MIHMTEHRERRFEEIADAQGWGADTTSGVLMDFIDNHADKAALIAYAEARAAEENSLSEEGWAW